MEKQEIENKLPWSLLGVAMCQWADLHLRAQNRVVTGQFGAVDGVHAFKGGADLCAGWRSASATLSCCYSGAGSTVQLEQRLDVGTVLVGQSLLVLVGPLTDSALPTLCSVLVQCVGFSRRVLGKRDEGWVWAALKGKEQEQNLPSLTFILIDFLEPSLKAWNRTWTQMKPSHARNSNQKWSCNQPTTLTFLLFGVPRAFSVLFFLFLDLLRLTRLTVSLMLVGVCWVAV